MKTRIVLSLTLSMLVLTGCLVTSVYPFYDQKDVVFEPKLVGDWTDSNNADEHWKFETNTANTYRFIYTTKSDTNVMQATYFKLHENAFLDMFNTELKDDTQPSPIPSHCLLRVLQTPPMLKMAVMDYDWLVMTLTNSPSALRHHWVQSADKPDDKRLILTADTAELQRFVLKHLGTADAWGKPIELTNTAAVGKPVGK